MPSFTSVEELYSCYLEADCDVSTDTRNIKNGSIFIALKGDKFNANEFANKAIEMGCKYAVVDDPKFANQPKIKLVQNSLAALQQLANYHRKQFKIPFLAITGSNGKTTNKELIHAVLSRKFSTLATFGNLNNHIGVPLTLLRLRKQHQFAIIEMGANHQGEIDLLCNIADPDYGLITNIGKAHLEGFGGIEGVKKGKTELYRYIQKKQGKIFINSDDEVLKELATDLDKISFGTNKNNFICGNESSDSSYLSFKYCLANESESETRLNLIRTHLIGSYNLMNCLAAVCIGTYFKVEGIDIKKAIEEYQPNMNRSQFIETGKNKLVLDAYNANPDSMKAAIENFASVPSTKKLLLLGDMFELGNYSHDEHLKIINLLKSLQLKDAILVGEEFYKLQDKSFTTFRTTQECKHFLEQKKVNDTTVLIKGSRGMKMEILQEVL